MQRTFTSTTGAVAGLLGALALLATASGASGGGSAALGSDVPTWSPDGQTIAFVGFRQGRAGDIYTIGAFGGRERRLTASKSHDDTPRWSPDGRRIAFVRTVGLVRQLVVMNADGTRQRQLTHGPDASYAPSWAPDSRRIAFVRGHDDIETDDNIPADGPLPGSPGSSAARTPSDIYVLDVDGGGVTRLTDHPAVDTSPAWSPDGELIVFTSNRGAAAAHQLYVMRADGSEQRKFTSHPISYHTEKRAAWSPDGSTIAFVADNRHVPVGNAEIYLVDADGQNVRRLTHYAGHDDWPAWSHEKLIAIARGLTPFRPEIFVTSASGGLGARKLTGKHLTFAHMSMTPSAPKAARPFTVELGTRPAIDGYTDVECRARLGDQLLVDPTVARVKGKLRCVWKLPQTAKGRMLRGVVLAAAGGSEIVRTFSLRVD